MTETNVKPPVTATVTVNVKSLWQHVTVIMATVMAVITILLAALVQLKDVPGLPTNVATWIASGIAILTAVVTIYQKLYAITAITPTVAAKLQGITDAK